EPGDTVRNLIERRGASLRRIVGGIFVADRQEGEEERLIADVRQHGALVRVERTAVAGFEVVHARAEFIEQSGPDVGGGGEGVKKIRVKGRVRWLERINLTSIAIKTKDSFDLARKRETRGLRQGVVDFEIVEVEVVGGWLLPVVTRCVE